MEVTDLVLVSDLADVREAVTTTAAALGHDVVSCDPAAIGPRWSGAGSVFVGVDRAAELAALALPRRERVYLIGADSGVAARWSVPLGAEVIPLPEGRSWLSSLLAGGGAGAGDLVALLGGSGGVGASTLAAVLAWRAAGSGQTVALVDADPLGGGIDLLLGAEREPGWRWPRLAAADGFVGDLREFLPEIDGITVLSMAREPDGELGREPLAAVLASLRRSFELVVVDPGRGWPAGTRQVLRTASRALVVVGGTVRGVAAAGEVLRDYHPPAAELVVRRFPGVRVPDQVVEDALGVPITARFRHDPRLVVAAERGERPDFGSRRKDGLARLCDRLLGK